MEEGAGGDEEEGDHGQPVEMGTRETVPPGPVPWPRGRRPPPLHIQQPSPRQRLPPAPTTPPRLSLSARTLIYARRVDELDTFFPPSDTEPSSTPTSISSSQPSPYHDTSLWGHPPSPDSLGHNYMTQTSHPHHQNRSRSRSRSRTRKRSTSRDRRHRHRERSRSRSRSRSRTRNRRRRRTHSPTNQNTGYLSTTSTRTETPSSSDSTTPHGNVHRHTDEEMEITRYGAGAQGRDKEMDVMSLMRNPSVMQYIMSQISGTTLTKLPSNTGHDPPSGTAQHTQTTNPPSGNQHNTTAALPITHNTQTTNPPSGNHHNTTTTLTLMGEQAEIPFRPPLEPTSEPGPERATTTQTPSNQQHQHFFSQTQQGTHAGAGSGSQTRAMNHWP